MQADFKPLLVHVVNNAFVGQSKSCPRPDSNRGVDSHLLMQRTTVICRGAGKWDHKNLWPFLQFNTHISFPVNLVTELGGIKVGDDVFFRKVSYAC